MVRNFNAPYLLIPALTYVNSNVEIDRNTKEVFEMY